MRLRPFPNALSITPERYSVTMGKRLDRYLKNVKYHFAREYLISTELKDSIYNQLISNIGKDSFIELEKKHHNEFLEDLLMNTAHLDMVYRGDDQLIQKKDPIMMRPYSYMGRAHFYSPYKIIGNWEISTFAFNLFFLWAMTTFLYVTLLDNSLKKLIKFFESPPVGRYEEQRLSAFGRIFDTVKILFNYHKVYRRARNFAKMKNVE